MAKQQSIRSVLCDLHDSQSRAEAKHYAQQVAARRSEDPAAIQEFLTCGHVDHADVLEEVLRGS